MDPGISGEPNVSYCYTGNSNCPDIQYGATDLHGSNTEEVGFSNFLPLPS